MKKGKNQKTDLYKNSYTYYEQYITGDDLYHLNFDNDNIKTPNKINTNKNYYEYDKPQNNCQYFYDKNYDKKYDNNTKHKKSFINKNISNNSPIEETEMSIIIPMDPPFSLSTPDSSDSILQLLFPTHKTGSNKENKKPEVKKNRENFIKGDMIDVQISSLDDLINLANEYEKNYDKSKTYCLDFNSLIQMLPHLIKLNKMIGLSDLKFKIVYQILFYLQGLDIENKDMLHTVIEGNPGVGKTEVAKILAKIYNSLGILSKGTFQSVKRSDLIGSYLGQTANKTQKILDNAVGGVLFIDEAYSLGNEDGKDIYSKECIDTITSFLSENRANFVCIIAGYKKDLRDCFFKYNSGLERRFPWVYTINNYNDKQLKLIYEKIVIDNDWKCNCKLSFFTENLKLFKNQGGDMELLFQKSKLAHSFRCLKLKPEDKKKINMDDINYALTLFSRDKIEKKDYMMYT